MQKTRAPKATPSRGDSNPAQSTGRQLFVGSALNMSWQLAVVVLVPVIGGAELGKKLGAPTVWTAAGLVLAVIASAVVMWRTVQTANNLPVPKLTTAQRRAIKKSYEEDDD